MTRSNVTDMHPLPPAVYLSPSVLSFLNAKLSTKGDLIGAPNLLSELRIECNGLDQALSDLNKQLQRCLIDYASHFDQLKSLFSNINSQLLDLRASTQSPPSSSDGGSGRVLGEELPALAKEVARVETVRMYAGNACSCNQNSKNDRGCFGLSHENSSSVDKTCLSC